MNLTGLTKFNPGLKGWGNWGWVLRFPETNQIGLRYSHRVVSDSIYISLASYVYEVGNKKVIQVYWRTP